MTKEINYKYLDELNPQQREAVVYKDGPALVIAGAGSGKTRVLTYKIVDLLHSGYEAYRILALTFTNKAAREMKERIAGLTGERVAAKLWMGTFHSIFLRILRRHAEELGFKPGFTIYDTADTRSLIKTIIKDLELDDKIYKPAAIASHISNMKNAMVSAEAYLADKDYYESDRRAKRPLTGKIFSMYCNRCRKANAMDFDDILYYMNILLRDHPDICRHYREFFRYILVDEYQDTNFAQHLVIQQLCAGKNNICVVGDDAQSIYSFRGANIKNILQLENKFPGLRIFKLERNYRSTKNIVEASGSLISKNTMQLPKNVFSENERGEKIDVVKTYSDLEEAYIVASRISSMKLKYHDSYEDYAILYRTNAQSRILEEALRKRNIPYRIYGGLSFYQRKEIKDVISYFRLAINPDDDEALKRIINYPARGIGETTLKKLQRAALDSSKSIWEVICSLPSPDVDVNSGTLKKLVGFKELIQCFIDDNAKDVNAYELAQLIYNRTGILTQFLHDNTPETISRQENLSELMAGLKEFVEFREESGEEDMSMRAFLSEVMLATDQDEKEDNDEPKVTLMTAHAAKGLEFPHIVIVGVEEELFPSSMSMDSIANVEEERRLLYVAITRAEKTCMITYAGSRFRNGQTVLTRPSRFLSDIGAQYLSLSSSGDIDSGYDRPSFINPRQNYMSGRYGNSGSFSSAGDSLSQQSGGMRGSSRTRTNMSNLKPVKASNDATLPGVGLEKGTRIRHQKFGEGVVIATDNVSGNPSVTVDFGVVGIKKLLLKFAKFTII